MQEVFVLTRKVGREATLIGVFRTKTKAKNWLVLNIDPKLEKKTEQALQLPIKWELTKELVN